MASIDPTLGQAIHEHLKSLGLETPLVGNYVALEGEYAQLQHDRVEKYFSEIMRELGLDLKDDSLAETPRRIAKMFTREIFQGLNYGNFPKCTTVQNRMAYQEMVSVNDISVKSVCEHHFLPFIGTACVAYIPEKKVVGLSKLNRVVEFFSRRPQIQERLTEQVCAALKYILETEDVAVVIKANHTCVSLRGVEDSSSYTVTSRLSGKFRAVAELRAEFLALSRGD